MPQTRATVVVLMNHYEPGQMGTVWVVPGDYQPARDEEPLPDELPRAIRIAGPIDLSECPGIVAGLRRAFDELGIATEELVYSDD